jgi:hypothetical protein
MFSILVVLCALAVLCSLKAAGDGVNYSGVAEYTAPTGGVTRGKIYLISGQYVVAQETKDATVAFRGRTGPVEVTKATGTGKSFVIGEKVYALSNVINKTATGAVLVGVCLEAAATTDTSIKIDTGTGLAVTAT